MNHAHPSTGEQVAREAVADAMREITNTEPSRKATDRLVADIFAEPDGEELFDEFSSPYRTLGEW